MQNDTFWIMFKERMQKDTTGLSRNRKTGTEGKGNRVNFE